MKYEDAVAAIALHEALVERFTNILCGAPFWKDFNILDQEHMRVSIKRDEATITWPKLEYGYEHSCFISQEDYSIPLSLLFISEDDLVAWKIEQRAIYDRKQQERQAATACATEAKERADLAALKAKYETK